MSKNKAFCCVLILICALCVCAVVTYAATDDNDAVAIEPTESAMFIAGQHYKTILQTDGLSTSNETTIVASYHGHNITSRILEYQRDMNELFVSVGSASYETDREIINRIIRGIMLTEEAERLGLTATDDEINARMDSVLQAYSLPDGKEMIEVYCEGAGITVDEYFQKQREQIPESVAHRKLKNEICKQYCLDNNLEYNANAPLSEDMLAAEDAYIAALFERNKNDIVYYLDEAEIS